MPASCVAFARCWLMVLVSVGCASRVAGFHTSVAGQRAAARPALTCRHSSGVVLPTTAGAKRQWGLQSLSAQQTSSLPSLECVKNIRDLASVKGSPVKAGRVFRTSCVGTASEEGACLIVENIKTLIDLRSDKEYKMDSQKYNSTVWDNYDDMIYSVKKGTHSQKYSL